MADVTATVALGKVRDSILAKSDYPVKAVSSDTAITLLFSDTFGFKEDTVKDGDQKGKTYETLVGMALTGTFSTHSWDREAREYRAQGSRRVVSDSSVGQPFAVSSGNCPMFFDILATCLDLAGIKIDDSKDVYKEVSDKLKGKRFSVSFHDFRVSKLTLIP